MKKFFILFIIFLLLIGGVFFCHKKIQQINSNKEQSVYSKKENKLKKVAVLSIALGRYNVFWKDFYISAEKYFLPENRKIYYVFTDDKNLPFKDNKNVHVIYHKKMGWPYDALMRYDLFLSQKEELKKYDYLFFFNMNLEFKKEIGDEVFPDEKHDGIVFSQHFIHYHTLLNDFPYERNPKSTAYIPYDKGYVYAPGGFNGGETKAFLQLSEYCSKNIHTDLNNGIIAIWHDESYFNKYILDKYPLILPPKYMWSDELMRLSDPGMEDIKASLRDKQKYGGRAYLRGQTNIKSTHFNRFLYRTLSIISFSKKDRLKYKKIYEIMLK